MVAGIQAITYNAWYFIDCLLWPRSTKDLEKLFFVFYYSNILISGQQFIYFIFSYGQLLCLDAFAPPRNMIATIQRSLATTDQHHSST